MSRSIFLWVTLWMAFLSPALAVGQRTVSDAQGVAVAVPIAPKRVVVLSEPELDALLALQLTPVGATSGRGHVGLPRYLQAAAAQVTLVGSFGSPVLDRVIALQPDLILAGGVTEPELLSQLKKIAPTVVSFQPRDDWKTAFRRIAATVDRLPQAEQVLAGTAARVAQVRERLGARAQATVSVVRWNPQGPAYMLRDSFASAVLADLQLVRPAAQRQPGIGHSPPLSLEALQLIDGDWLFLGTLAPSGQAHAALEAARRSTAFSQLNAVKAGRAVVVDGSLWTGLGGPLAAAAVLDDVERAMGTGR